MGGSAGCCDSAFGHTMNKQGTGARRWATLGRMAEPGTDGYVVITGGPGAGKSTLIDALAAKGFARTDEAGRAIIQDRLAIGATGWSDPELFAELMLSWELRSHRQAAGSRGPVFFDRGVPDLVGYFRLIGRPLPAHVHEAALRFRYHRVVFAAPRGARSTCTTQNAPSRGRRRSAPTTPSPGPTPSTATRWSRSRQSPWPIGSRSSWTP